MQYEFHEVANIFPMMSSEEFKDLVTSIKQNGQRDPITLYEGKIIDGRNRYTACNELGIEPILNDWDEEGSILDFVKDKNLNRRQLSKSQLSLIASEMRPRYAEEARLRQLNGLATSSKNRLSSFEPNLSDETGTTNKIVGDMFGVAESMVKRANKVIKDGIPEVIEAVRNGNVSVGKAETISSMPKDQQPEILKKVIANEPIKPKPIIPPEPTTPPVFMEGAKELQEVIENIMLQLGSLIGQAETEINKLPNLKNVKYQVGACVDAIHKYADRLEIQLKLKK